MEHSFHASTPRGLSPAGAQTFAARNLALLATIEKTLDALLADTKLLDAIHDGYAEIRARLDGRAGAIDADGRIACVLALAADSCARIHHDARQRHHSACLDPQLRPDDGVADAYEQFISAISDLHDAIEDLRGWIADHDAVLEPSISATYADVDDLVRNMLSDQ